MLELEKAILNDVHQDRRGLNNVGANEVTHEDLHEVTLVLTIGDTDASSWLSFFEQKPLPGTAGRVSGGAILLTFKRDSPNLSSLLISAVEEARTLGARIKSLSPHYLLSASEAAARLGISAAAITQHQKRGYKPPFPPPVCRMLTERALFDWADVAIWAYRRGKLDWKSLSAALVMREAILLIGLHEQSPARLISEMKKRLPALEADTVQQ